MVDENDIGYNNICGNEIAILVAWIKNILEAEFIKIRNIGDDYNAITK